MRRHWHHEWESKRPDWQQPGNRDHWRGITRLVGFGFFIMVLFVFSIVGLMLWALANFISAGAVALVASPFLVGIVGLVILRSLFRTWRPVRGLVRMAGSLADGDYTARAHEPMSGSMRAVVRSFNKMADRLEDADEQRRRLLADLGHEIRTPLTVVRGEIEAMLDGVHDPDPDHLEALLDEVRVMERLVEDLRTLTLAEAGELSLHPEPTDVGELVGDVVEAHRRSAESQGVLVRIKSDPSLDDFVVDPVRIREVVTNLVVNALSAMPHGGALTVQVDTPGGNDRRIVVSDTGLGIPAGELEDVFERFHRGDRSGGTGLGLTISRDLVEAHGGTISIDSEVGVGTNVTLVIPPV